MKSPVEAEATNLLLLNRIRQKDALPLPNQAAKDAGVCLSGHSITFLIYALGGRKLPCRRSTWGGGSEVVSKAREEWWP